MGSRKSAGTGSLDGAAFSPERNEQNPGQESVYATGAKVCCSILHTLDEWYYRASIACGKRAADVRPHFEPATIGAAN